MVIAKLECTKVPFLSTAEALDDLTSEVQVFTTMYLYRRCKLFLAANQEITSSASGQTSNLGDDHQHIPSPDSSPKAHTILHEMAQILREVGYDPQPDMQDERLDRFSLRSSRHLFAEPTTNIQHATQIDEATQTLESDTATTMPLTPPRSVSSKRKRLAAASTQSDLEHESPPCARKRRRIADY